MVKWTAIREARAADLASCDYAAFPDYPLGDDERAQLVKYRQALRDVPDQGVDPDSVVWPERPAFLK